ncbi:MAG TPA: hypothetical protein VGN12_20490 [Pirellulales bacterium]
MMVQVSRATVSDAVPSRIGLRELERAVRAADPAALLVAPRILRRVIKQNARLPGFGLHVPHRKSYVLPRGELLELVDPDELDLASGDELPETVILLSRPTAERLVVNTAADNLTSCWRLLFHARVHQALDQQVAVGHLSPAEVQKRIAQIGTSEFAEIRAVLKQEDFLIPPATDLSIYIEFAALFLELRFFADAFLHSYFPAIDDFARIDKLLAEDLDAAALFQATRPPGAPELPARRDTAAEELAHQIPEPQPPMYGLPSIRAMRRLLDKAARSSVRGNLVRAAILRVAAATRGNAEQSRLARSEARADMDRLAERLQAALGFDDDEREDWARMLALLTTQAARGFWTSEARLLYDLQKVCVDHERGVYTFDLPRWIRSGFRAPIKRLLPGQRNVLFSKHLRSAVRRLAAIRVSERVRARMGVLLQVAVERAEENLRSRFRPTIAAALDRVPLRSQNLPEGVAREKLIEELLDRIVERGFLTMGDLRDGLSRNNLKMPDVASLRQLILGDQLLQTNWQLAENMDGVYHRGEIYLTLPQRLSSLAFGTPLGRFLTQYVVLPFGGAFLIQKGVQHIIAPHSEQSVFDPFGLVALAYMGFFLLGLLHVHRFRMICLDVVWLAGRAARSLFIDLPKQLLELPVVQSIVHSVYFRLLQRGLFKPLLVTAVVAPLMSYGFGVTITAWRGLTIFLIANLVLNSRIGRDVDELISDWLAQAWHRFRIRVLAALLRFIMDVFSRLLENIERMLYTVDEWLRFRTGERPTAVAVKAVLGVLWFFVNYFIRFAVTLLIEPQINPIKHFPVVTVSHKILLPLTVPFDHFLRGPLGSVWAATIAPTVVLLLPGVFGFLVWELKENWRLYAANRPKNLGPIAIGHHGEAMVQFMRVGFRSGTLPKLFAKLRRANRKAYWSGKWKVASKHLAGLHHAEEDLRRFVDRDLLLILRHSHGWCGLPIEAGRIGLATNRVLFELVCPDVADDSLWLEFEERHGWLVAGIYQRGWLDMLRDTQRNTLDNALAGFYKEAGADLVLDQLETQLAAHDVSYAIDDAGLMVWPDRSSADATLVPLRDWPPAPRGHLPAMLPAVPLNRPERLVFARAAISWQRWVTVWDHDQSHVGTTEHAINGVSLLPTRNAT